MFETSSRERAAAVLLAALSVSLAGCATQNAVFVTKTSLSVVDIDTTPASVSFAHDRVEGYFGPRFNNGQVYPVTGYYYAEGSGLTRNVRQVFAGGAAATIVLEKTPTPAAVASCGDGRNHPPLLFVTGTTLGVKLGFAEGTPVPTSFVFGFRRKEAATVPVSISCQPSVLASIDSDAQARAQPTDPKLGASAQQYFATGAAADALAADPTIQRIFRREAVKAVGPVAEFNQLLAEHSKLTLDILSCASKLPEAGFDRAVTNADELGLFPHPADAARIRAVADPNERLKRYIGLLPLRNGDQEPRTAALTVHKARVCAGVS